MAFPKYFRTYVVISLILFASGIILIRIERTLEGYDVYEGPVEEIKIASVKDTDGSVSKIVYFTMKGLDAKLGIRENFGDYSVFINNLKPGDTAKIYYKKNYIEISTDVINHYVFQLEKKGVPLLDIKEANKENKIAGYILISAGLISGVLTTRYYRRNVKRKDGIS